MENNNSVCFVGIINEIFPIEGADNIELGKIGGWSCILKKGEYQPGNMVIVATTDAVIPEKLSSGLGIKNYLRKEERVRTIKLRGVYSECLIIPISFIPIKYRKEGVDCMELLEIFKYEPPIATIQLSSGKKIRYSKNPNFNIYYKFPNLKNVQGMFNEEDWVQITRKLHGTNARFGWVRKNKLSLLDKIKKFFFLHYEEYEYVYGSHNVEKGSDTQGFYSTDVWRTIAEKLDIKNKLKEMASRFKDIGSGIVIYGEIFGPGIQSNFDYGLDKIHFNVFDITFNGNYLPPDIVEDETEYYLELEHVPVLYNGLWNEEIQNSFVFNNFINGTKIPHEGIVIKPFNGGRNKVAKVINPDYTIYSEKNNVSDSH